MKNTDRLEDFVRLNREKFDNLEPSPDIWGKIEKSTSKNKVVGLRTILLRIAAVIAIVSVTAITVTNTFLRDKSYGEVSDPEITNLLDTERYYARQISGKLDEIKKCYATFPDIQNEVETDLNELELMYNLLKIDLEENISNKAVIEAMIENNRFRLKLVDSILEQVEC